MSLRITILGSGTIIPASDRRATSLVVQRGDEWTLFDCGPGSLEALEEGGFSFREVARVFLTHFHPDHTLGIGHLLAARRVDRASGGGGSLALYGPPGIVDFIERWHALYPSTVLEESSLEIRAVEDGAVHSGGGIAVRAAPVDHDGAAAVAYRIEAEGRAIVYTGDCAYTESLADLARGADLLIAECSFPDDRPVAGHMTPSGVGRLASRSGAARVVLVHLYPVFGDADPAALVRAAYLGPVAVGADGMRVEL